MDKPDGRGDVGMRYRALATHKQIARIQRLMEMRGREFVERYFYQQFPRGEFEKMSRKQAQKVITGLVQHEKCRPISGVWINTDWMGH